MPHARHHKLQDVLLLVVWLAIGTGLRLTRLATKPPWTDEFSTIVFSLGNSFLSVPLDRAIALDVLLQPLQPRSDSGVCKRRSALAIRKQSSSALLCAGPLLDAALAT